MIVDRLRGRSILVRHRDPDTHKRIETKITDVMPYCFVKSDVANMVSCIGREDGFKGLYGEDLTKCIFSDPGDVGVLKKGFQTWEANIPRS